MKIAIKNPAPLGDSLTRWGDYHFGTSLQHALEARGVEVGQHFWPEWDRDDGEEAVLVLRGKRRWRLVSDKQAMLWIISHPATISAAELDGFDVVFSASETFLHNVAGSTSTPVEVMRQCTDTRWFHTEGRARDVGDRYGLVFVANSRGVRREIMGWAVETGMLPTLIGSQWEQFGLEPLVRQEFIDNTQLPDLYRSSRVALNDHWGDMRYFGIISNRIFDCLACGLPVVSDGFPELVEVCGDGVHVVHDVRSYWDAIWKHRTRYLKMHEGALRAWERIGRDHTFDARAEQIIAHLGRQSRRKARPFAAAPTEALGAEWIEELLDEVVTRRGSKSTSVRVLHLCPSVESAAHLAGLGRVQLHTAGPGEGPWQFPITPTLAAMFAGEFDAIVVERDDLWRRVEEPAAVLDGLSSLVAGHGVVMMGPDQEPSWKQTSEDREA